MVLEYFSKPPSIQVPSFLISLSSCLASCFANRLPFRRKSYYTDPSRYSCWHHGNSHVLHLSVYMRASYHVLQWIHNRSSDSQSYVSQPEMTNMFLRSSSAWIGHSAELPPCHVSHVAGHYLVPEVDQVRRQYKQLTSFWKLHRRDSQSFLTFQSLGH